MRIGTMRVENFMGLAGEHTVPWGSLGLAHIAGVNLDDPGNSSNGAGKSTMLEALTWGLFGEGLPRPQGNTEQGARADEVLNDRVGKQCRVEVELVDEVEGKTYVVARWRKWKGNGETRAGNGVSLATDGAVTQALDEDEANRQIQTALGITHEIWCRGVVFGQESGFNFCDATAGQRQDILTTVLGLEVVDTWHERCRDEKRALTTKMAEWGGQVAVRRAELARVQADDPSVRMAAWEADRGEQLRVATAKQATVADRGKTLVAQLAAMPPVPDVEAIAPVGLPAWVEPPDPAEDPAIAAAWQALGVEEQTARAAVRTAEAAVSAADRDRQNLAAFNAQAVCPTCRQEISAAHKQACMGEATLRVDTSTAAAQASYAALEAVLRRKAGLVPPDLERQRVAGLRAEIASQRRTHQQEVSRLTAEWGGEGGRHEPEPGGSDRCGGCAQCGDRADAERVEDPGSDAHFAARAG